MKYLLKKFDVNKEGIHKVNICMNIFSRLVELVQ
jgi:hypothetical protein